ncbi:hypothetical protein [Neisseria mucosa]|nr:hypothetical protein [Neisseria mucosa]
MFNRHLCRLPSKRRKGRLKTPFPHNPNPFRRPPSLLSLAPNVYNPPHHT